MKEFLVAVLVIGVIVFVIWRVGAGRKKRPGRRNPTTHDRRMAGGSLQQGHRTSDKPGDNSENPPGSGRHSQTGVAGQTGTRSQAGAAGQAGSSADRSLEACYRAYLNLEAAKHRRQAAAVVLTRQAGILERIQMLLGFYQDIAAGGNTYGASSRSYVEGQLRAIEEDLERFSHAKGNPMGKEQYFRSLQLDPNDRARAEALLHQMEREKEHLEREEQYRFYLGILKALSAFSWSLQDSREAFQEQEDFLSAFSRLCGSLTETLSRAGVIFAGCEEVDEAQRSAWFRTLDSAKSYPCALKKEDKTLLVYGRAAKAREADDKRKGRGGNRK